MPHVFVKEAFGALGFDIAALVGDEERAAVKYRQISHWRRLSGLTRGDAASFTHVSSVVAAM